MATTAGSVESFSSSLRASNACGVLDPARVPNDCHVHGSSRHTRHSPRRAPVSPHSPTWSEVRGHISQKSRQANQASPKRHRLASTGNTHLFGRNLVAASRRVGQIVVKPSHGRVCLRLAGHGRACARHHH